MISILGAGESGIGAALLAKKHNLEVFVSDHGEIRENFKQELIQNNIPFEQGKHTEDIILKSEEIIKSPGIPNSAPIIQKAIEKGIPIISEIEFAARYTSGIFIAITGSNGKTTTTTLIYEILKNAGYDVAITGNIGKSLARTICERDYRYYVVELSSFQLDNCYNFNPHIAILLNITPDHLDRYEYKFENYIKSKFRIIQNHTEKDFFIFWAEDSVIQKEIDKKEIKSTKIPFAWDKKNSNIAYVEKDKIIIQLNEKKFTMKINKIKLKGRHNIYNSMAAAAAALAVEVKNKYIRRTLRKFEGVEHRLEKVLTIRGISFVNDSKATNVNSVWYALESMNTPVVLIMGGIDKGNDYSILYPLVKEKVRAIVALGKDNSKIINAFKDIVPVYDTHSMKEAVEKAYITAHKGDTVLLSPACASFDLFKNYIDRGNKFKQAIRNL